MHVEGRVQCLVQICVVCLCTLWTLPAEFLMSHNGSLLCGCINFCIHFVMWNSALGLFCVQWTRQASECQSSAWLCSPYCSNGCDRFIVWCMWEMVFESTCSESSAQACSMFSYVMHGLRIKTCEKTDWESTRTGKNKEVGSSLELDIDHRVSCCCLLVLGNWRVWDTMSSCCLITASPSI